ncbi:MAG: hypothetical protein MI864_00165 [Pseudomonadales bacterium]|nr:hypothetical protein [Pseudomonadales bacterium]
MNAIASTEDPKFFSYQQALIESRLKKPGLRCRVDAKCIECIYDPAQRGTWVAQIRNCTSISCPLYDVRKGAGQADDESASEEFEEE